MYKKRALRRWQQQIKYKKTIEILNQRRYNNKRTNHKHAVRLINNLAVCSCYMCRNPRHNDWLSNEERLTIQERQHNDIFKLWKTQ